MVQKRYFVFFQRETCELIIYDNTDKTTSTTKIEGSVPSDDGYPLQFPFYPWTLDMMLDWVVDHAHISPSLCEAMNAFVGEEMQL